MNYARLSLIVVVLAVCSLPSSGQTVSTNTINGYVSFTDVTRNPATVTHVTVNPLCGTYDNGADVVLPDQLNFNRYSAASITTGNLTVSNLLVGIAYQFVFSTFLSNYTNTYSIPVTATNNASGSVPIRQWQSAGNLNLANGGCPYLPAFVYQGGTNFATVIYQTTTNVNIFQTNSVTVSTTNIVNFTNSVNLTNSMVVSNTIVASNFAPTNGTYFVTNNGTVFVGSTSSTNGGTPSVFNPDFLTNYVGGVQQVQISTNSGTVAAIAAAQIKAVNPVTNNGSWQVLGGAVLQGDGSGNIVATNTSGTIIVTNVTMALVVTNSNPFLNGTYYATNMTSLPSGTFSSSAVNYFMSASGAKMQQLSSGYYYWLIGTNTPFFVGFGSSQYRSAAQSGIEQYPPTNTTWSAWDAQYLTAFPTVYPVWFTNYVTNVLANAVRISSDSISATGSGFYGNGANITGLTAGQISGLSTNGTPLSVTNPVNVQLTLTTQSGTNVLSGVVSNTVAGLPIASLNDVAAATNALPLLNITTNGNVIASVTLNGNTNNLTLNVFNGSGLTNLSAAAVAAAGAITNIPTGSSVYVANNGNDTTGKRGQIQRPFAGVASALTNSIKNDTIVINSGLYVIPVINPQIVTTNASIHGSGRNLTTIIALANGQIGYAFNSWDDNNNFKDITFLSTNDAAGYISIPLFLSSSDSSLTTLTNCFDNCTIDGKNDCVVYITYVNNFDDSIYFEFNNVKFKNEWDSIADFGQGYDDYGGNTNAMIKLVGCEFQQNPLFPSENPNGDVHIFNVVPLPGVTIVNSFGSLTGCRTGMCNTNNAPYHVFGCVTNCSLIMANDHFDFTISTNYSTGTTPLVFISPLDFCKIYNHYTQNISVQNVSWTSNGVPFTLVEYTSPTNYTLFSKGIVTVFTNGVQQATGLLQ